MKLENVFSGLSAVMLVMIFTACGPQIKKGESIQAGKGLVQRYWNVNNAALRGDTVILGNSSDRIVSKFKVRDFMLSVNLFTTQGADGTLAFHTGTGEDGEDTGYSVMINNSDYRQGSPEKTGSLTRIRNNYVRTVHDDKWFNLRLEVRGNHICTYVNDKIISEYRQPNNPARVEGLEGMILSDGRLVLKKTSNAGQILIGDIRIESFDTSMNMEIDTTFISDSTGEMLTLLNQLGFPVIDYHGHLKGGLTVAEICSHGRAMGYNYGIAPNCGLNFPVTNDSSLLAYYVEMADEPVFKAMQCEGREWITLFSPEVIARYDYIFTDAMTWTDHKGRRMRLWIPEETFVDQEQQFMEMLVGKIEAELSQEPVDVYVNPTYLPEIIAGDYDRLWTPERMDRVIKVLVENDVALEINARFRIPSLAFVKRAKAAGVKFTLGTNNAGNTDLGRLEYSLQVIRKAGITAEDMFFPRPSGDKKVLIKGLPAKITG